MVMIPVILLALGTQTAVSMPLCTTGGFQVCSSVNLGLTYDASRERTVLVVQMLNFEGLGYPTSCRGTWHNSLGILPTICSGFSIWNIAGQAPSGWSNPEVRFGMNVFPTPEDYAQGENLHWADLAGGYDDPAHGWLFVFGQGTGSVLTITFDAMPGRWELTEETYLNLPGGVCTVASGCLLVTPEPFTVALLATGLLGLGGVGLRRRWKEGD